VELPVFYFGIKRERYKPWKLFDGTPVMVPGDFNVEVDRDGNWLLHDRGDFTKPIVAKMPKDGYYFDDLRIIHSSADLRRSSLCHLREEYMLTDEELEFIAKRAFFLCRETDKTLIANPYLKLGKLIIFPFSKEESAARVSFKVFRASE
jgi:hypothetical protein